MEETLQIIWDIVAEKVFAHTYPTHALTHEVISRRPEAKQELEELERAGRIKTGRTINSRWIEVVSSR